MSTFQNAIGIILRHEGGYVNNPNDPGGVTNFGISLRFLSQHPDIGDFDHDGDVDAEDIKNLTPEQASTIYKNLWWDEFNYGNINSQQVATKTFDLSVNMGAKRAHMLLQTAVNNAFGLKLTVDGALGNASFSTLNSIGDEHIPDLITAFCDATWAYYQSLIAKNPKLQVFAKGWKNRAYDPCTQ